VPSSSIDAVSRRGAARRRLAAAAVALAALAGAGSARGFGLDDVAERAQKLAAAPFQASTGDVPDWLTKISYDQWRDIRFRPESALWAENRSSFQVQFFHVGLFYDRAVKIHVVDAEGVRPVPFSPSDFDYGRNDFGSRVPQGIGFAGFRLHYPIRRADYLDEVIVFLGASYFRAIGKQHVYGLSARGLAIDTASRSGEEFPWFREFWLERPAAGATSMVIYALLDSPRVAGAYRFAVFPGEQTKVDVESRLFLRAEIEKLGIAPLTSMFFFGENSDRRFDDFRPEVHDSDGLLLAGQSGEWLWRPLDNRPALHVSSFELNDPKGFGLIQRDRDFDHYHDLEARPDLRPSTWVAPRGNWGPGRVELVEIPTNRETNDNIVAYWVPRQPLPAGVPHTFAYSMAWYSDDKTRPPGGRVDDSRRDRAGERGAHRFVIEFVGRELEALPAETVLQGVVTIGSGPGQGELVEQRVEKNPVTGGFRLVFQVRPATDQPVELRAFLQQGQSALTETWTYLLVP
jgi:glucans biosynthesis protein